MRILFLGTRYCGTKLGEYNLQLGIKMEGMHFHCRQSRQYHLNVGTGLGILLPDVQSVCQKTKRIPAQSTSPTVEGCRKNKGLRISCHQVRFLAVPYTSWVTLGKLLNRSEHMFLICKVRLIISKCWLIVRIVDNVHKTQNVFSKHRRSMINVVFIFYPGENFVIF